MMDNKPRPSGPNGECCEQCRFSYILPNYGQMVCRLNPPLNLQEVFMDEAAILKPGVQPQPQVRTNIVHPYTFPHEWCSRFERRVKLASVSNEGGKTEGNAA